MTIEKILVSGEAGQGVLFAGRVLARAGMLRGLEVSFVPDAGPRGSRVGVLSTVILHSSRIGSPLVSVPDALVALDPESADRFSGRVKPGGLLLLPPPQAAEGEKRTGPGTRDDVRIVVVPARRLAIELGDPRSANLVALGAFAALSTMIGPEDLAAGWRSELDVDPARAPGAGAAALEAGTRWVKERRYMRERYALSLFAR